MKARWLTQQQDEPGDDVVARSEAHTVGEFLGEALGFAGIDRQKHVEIDPKCFRTSEVDQMQVDAFKARVRLDWAPKVSFTELARIVLDGDLDIDRRERTLADSGYDVAESPSSGAIAPVDQRSSWRSDTDNIPLHPEYGARS